MTKQIRKKVFETNSSSSHSLTLSKGDLVKQPFSKQQLRDGVIDLRVGEYGWEWRRYYASQAKLEYLLTQITDGNLPEGDSDDVTRELLEDNERFAMLAHAVREHTGCALRVHASSGYIDHQSASSDKGNGLELFNNAETLRHFLFNAESYIQTGNDNNAAGWFIKTDRGDELFYEQHIAEVPADYVTVKFAPLHNFRSDGFATGTGGVVTPGKTPRLHSGLLKSAIVVSAHWTCMGYSNNFEHRDVVGHSAAEASRGGAGYGFKLAPNFSASSEYRRGDGHDERVSFVAWVPKTLADQLAALDPKGHRDYQLAEAARLAKDAVRELKKDPTHRYYVRQLADSRALTLKLGGKKALAALPTMDATEPARKPAAKKAPAKKAAAKKVTK